MSSVTHRTDLRKVWILFEYLIEIFQEKTYINHKENVMSIYFNEYIDNTSTNLHDDIQHF